MRTMGALERATVSKNVEVSYVAILSPDSSTSLIEAREKGSQNFHSLSWELLRSIAVKAREAARSIRDSKNFLDGYCAAVDVVVVDTGGS